MSQKLEVKQEQKQQSFPKIEQVLTWYPVIKREFPDDEKDFGGWNYDE